MPEPDLPRPTLPRGFRRLVAAQALSALADHALLILAIARMVELGAPAWAPPLLKFGFTAAYVLLAPLVGVLADATCKARVMAASHGLKTLGAALLLAGGQGWEPLAAYALAGLGAAIHSPAKYGLVAETVPPARLVQANGWLEASTVCAALFGAALGGLLLHPALGGPAPAALQPSLQSLGLSLSTVLPGVPAGQPGGSALWTALAALLLIDALAALGHLGLPRAGAPAARPRRRLRPHRLVRGFGADAQRLLRDPAGRLSLGVTVLTWGVGGALQFLVLRWGLEALGLGLDRAATLQGVVALGLVAGAAAAGRWIPLPRATRSLPLGLLLGMLIPAASLTREPLPGLALLLAVGALAGALIVPMNALLQARGLALLSASRTVAVQNFGENLGMLLMLALYSAATAAGLGLAPLALGLGLLVLLGMGLLMVSAAPAGHRPARPPSPPSLPPSEPSR